MEANEIFIALRKTGYRVVPEWRNDLRLFEIIIEPWDYEANKRIRTKKIKRTDVFIKQSECFMSVTKVTKLSVELNRIQMKIINHFEQKKLNKQL